MRRLRRGRTSPRELRTPAGCSEPEPVDGTKLKHLGLKLLWAKHQRGATEVFCELGE